MSETLDRTAEIAKLARLIDVEPEDLDFLGSVPASALSTYRNDVTDRLFAGDGDRLKRVAAASKLIPIPIVAKAAQLAFGPLLCAATASQLDPGHAIKVATKLPVEFLADVAITLDPRRAPDVIAAVPKHLVVGVAKDLIARGEHVTMGRFVNYLPKDTLAAAIDEIPGDDDILHTAFVMEGKDSLDDLLEIARHRIPGLIRAAYENDMWSEALDLITNLNDENLRDLADTAAGQGEEILDSLVRAVHRDNTWDALLPLTSAMSDTAIEEFAAVEAITEPDIMDAIVTAALDGPLWLDLLPLARHVPPGARARVSERAEQEDDETLERLATEAHDNGHWPAMLLIAAGFDREHLTRLARLELLQRDDVLESAVRAAADNGMWDAVLPLADVVPDSAKATLAKHVDALTEAQLLEAVEAALRSDNLPTLIEIALDVSQDDATRERVISMIANSERLEDFGALLDDGTPAAVWDALTAFREEIPEHARELVARKAAELGRGDVASAFRAEKTG